MSLIRGEKETELERNTYRDREKKTEEIEGQNTRPSKGVALNEPVNYRAKC